MFEIVPSVHGLRNDLRRRPKRPWGNPWGLCFHITGRGLADLARRRLGLPLGHKVPPEAVLRAGMDVYASGFGPAYMIGVRGEVVQIAPDDVVAMHVGGEHRGEYLSGAWKTNVPEGVRAMWQSRWPGRKSPQHLFPGPSANEAFIGVEVIPVTGVLSHAAGEGERYTLQSYQAAQQLAVVLAKRHGWPLGWMGTSRLVGHEDIGLLDRHDAGGGWDPGGLREMPYWRWDRITAGATLH